MTDLEAAEEILKGPFIKCIACNGNGPCMNCAGRGQLLRRDYQNACVHLGIGIPVHGWMYYDRDD